VIEGGSAQTILSSKRTLWFAAGLTVILFAVANLPWQLDDYDQAKQAFTSFQMIKEGRWFYQQTPHEHVATKPPLVGWISAGLFALTRSWDTAWRLPPFLAAIAIAMLLFRAAASAYGPIAGLIVLGAFGLNLLTPRLATLVRTDMPLALVIFLIGLLIWQKIRAETEWTRRERIYLFSLLTGAMLIKGPIVYAFLLPGIGIFEWWRSRQERLDTARRLQIGWSGPPQDGFAVANWWPWIASLAVFLLWVIGGILFAPGFFDQVVMREFVARFGETIHRPQPLYFYLPHLLHKFAPWSVLMIGVAIFDLASRRWRIGAAFREMSPETFWLFCWSLGGLIAMSLIPSKRVDRIFPIVPPLCLLLGAQISARKSCSHGSVSRSSISFESGPTAHRPVATKNSATPVHRWIAAALAFSILFTGGYTIFKIVSGYRDHHDALVVFGRNVRHEVDAHRWRYEVVSAKDEGLLLYLRTTHFIEPDRAVVEWNSGNLDVLVASTEKAPALLGELRGASLSSLKSNEKKKEQGRDYVLITR
jgi:4-amino-4-deoxy-L-arabinose transferase-like glycosyltransferase